LRTAALNTLHRKANDFLFRAGILSPKMEDAIGTRILAYHNVCSKRSSFNSRSLGKEEFQAQLKLILKHWDVISLEELISGQYEKSRFTVTLTFDDGLCNNLQTIVPLLEKFKVPATFFVCAPNDQNILWPEFIELLSIYHKKPFQLRGKDFSLKNGRYFAIDGQSLFDFCLTNGICMNDFLSVFPADLIAKIKRSTEEEFWRLLTKEEIAHMSTFSQVSIASHGINHRSLSHIDFETAEKELKKSRIEIENLIGKSVQSFSWPFGHCTQELISLANKCGYRYQFILGGDHSIHSEVVFERMGNNPFISSPYQIESFGKGYYR
jgi:peptidoglycan/xylan/chitin deacetylase (PgdA/CDA1 family)